MLDGSVAGDKRPPPHPAPLPLNFAAYRMVNGPTRRQSRLLDDLMEVEDLKLEEEVRLAIEERPAFAPDAPGFDSR